MPRERVRCKTYWWGEREREDRGTHTHTCTHTCTRIHEQTEMDMKIDAHGARCRHTGQRFDVSLPKSVQRTDRLVCLGRRYAHTGCLDPGGHLDPYLRGSDRRPGRVHLGNKARLRRGRCQGGWRGGRGGREDEVDSRGGGRSHRGGSRGAVDEAATAVSVQEGHLGGTPGKCGEKVQREERTGWGGGGSPLLR